MDHIERLAWISVTRGCGFGALAIFTLMIGFIATPAIAFEAGGIGFLMMAAILCLKARNASTLPYRNTEVWVMLDKPQRPPASIAGAVIAGARREALLRSARLSALTAAGCLGVALLLLLAGYGELSLSGGRIGGR